MDDSKQHNMADAEPFDVVIVPLDGSAAGEVVVPAARALAATMGAEVIFIRVVPYPEPPVHAPSHGPAPSPGVELPADVVAAEQEARTYLQEARTRLALPDATPVVAVGDPFRRIRAEIARHRRPVVLLTAKATAALPMSRDSELARRLVFAGIGPVMVVPPAGGGNPPAGQAS